MDFLEGHIHASGMAILLIVAVMGATHFLVRGVTGLHPNNPAAKGANWLWG